MDTDKIPLVQRPVHGDLVVTMPHVPDARRWLFDTIGWRSRLGQNKEATVFTMHRAHMPVVLRALASRFGAVDLHREYRVDDRCNHRCHRAQGDECVCSCGGERHGRSAEINWLTGLTPDEFALGEGGEHGWSVVRLTNS